MATSALEVDGSHFEFVKKRAYNTICVYKGDGEFLRIGPERLLKKDLDLHKRLLGFGFPVPKILKVGKIGRRFYYIEESFGDLHFGGMFGTEWKGQGVVSNASFSSFLKVVGEFGGAQISHPFVSKSEKDFYTGIHLDYLIEELPNLKTDVLRAFEKVKKDVSPFPLVLTHGDFNPYNLTPRGVIDIESMFHGPAGFDLIANVYTTYFFPKDGDYESLRRYEFTEAQMQKYMEMVDELYKGPGYPKLSQHQDGFALCRAVWAAVRMQKMPKLQEWRYRLLEKITADYLKGKSIANTIRTFKS